MNTFFHGTPVLHDQKPKFVETKINEIKKLCNTFEENSESKLILTSLQIPSYSSYGISEQREIRGLKEMVSEINNELIDHCRRVYTNHQIFIYDFNEFISRFGEKNIFNYKQFFSGDIKISTEYIPKFVNELMGYVYAISGITKKCIVVDLDNTLWGGVIGEDGFDNIKGRR